MKHLGKPIDEVREQDIKSEIMNGLKTFSPSLTPYYVKVEGDKVRNRWIISIVAFNESLNVGINNKTVIENKL